MKDKVISYAHDSQRGTLSTVYYVEYCLGITINVN
jgi:hypothetical protein